LEEDKDIFNKALYKYMRQTEEEEGARETLDNAEVEEWEELGWRYLALVIVHHNYIHVGGPE
jgi:hypothetical protein